MNFRYVYIDGRITEASEASISPLDRGFLRGEGIFETFRTYSGVIFRAHAHARRLHAGLRMIGVDPSLEMPVRRIRRIVSDLLAANRVPDAVARITVTPGSEAARAGMGPLTVFAHLRPLPAGTEHGVAIAKAPYLRDPANARLSVKATSYLEYLSVRRAAAAEGAWDAAFLNLDQSLAEGSASNLFLVAGGEVLTPHLASGILPGVMRDSVVRVCGREALRIRERRILLEEAFSASECFATNAVATIVPVRRLFGVEFCAAPGPVTRRLAGALQRWIEATIRRVRAVSRA